MRVVLAWSKSRVKFNEDILVFADKAGFLSTYIIFILLISLDFHLTSEKYSALPSDVYIIRNFKTFLQAKNVESTTQQPYYGGDVYFFYEIEFHKKMKNILFI